ncbi:ABC transporter permease [Suicoccus acidiformans]|uniref:ABC transporter permease n=1 Tax=Suicoccus acidiformans TaxID=2036206 RepID=A0A347WNE9_9LACT|nr:ABC transporter permease [Suicoccus acidiformans]AXY26606.1 ABC transporter permease [Suicoccus acidiformans]
MDVIILSFQQGVVWAVLGIGLYITFRLLDIADLSAEGVLPLGAAIAATLISQGINPYLATIVAFFGGMIAGLVSGFIHTKMKISPMITGILMQTGLYSINLHVMDGRPNIALLGQDTIFSMVEGYGLSRNVSVIVVSIIILALIIAALVWFLHTETGLALRATGDNERMSAANGINTNAMKTLGYMLSSGTVALAGAMVAQKDGFADIGMGIGTVVIGLASIVVAEVIIPNQSIGRRLTTIILGSFIYRLVIDFILNQNFIVVQPQDLRLFSALLLGLVLFVPEIQKSLKRRNRKA